MAKAPATPELTGDTTPAAKTKADRVAPIIATGIVEGFTPPAKSSRGGGSRAQYPFDALGVGEYFSVMNKNARQMTGPLTTAHKRYTNEIMGADGQPSTKSKEREFYALDVDAEIAAKLVGTPHEGATALLVRSK